MDPAVAEPAPGVSETGHISLAQSQTANEQSLVGDIENRLDITSLDEHIEQIKIQFLRIQQGQRQAISFIRL